MAISRAMVLFGFHPAMKILSLNNFQTKHKVMYQNTLNNGFVVHIAHGTNQLFMFSNGPFFSDVKNDVEHLLSLT